ncbi:hypothetical protein BHE74_00039914, partial [Ensete ventricosum]
GPNSADDCKGSRDRNTSSSITNGDAGPQEQDVPTIGPRGTLVRSYRSRPRDMELSLEGGSIRTLARRVLI